MNSMIEKKCKQCGKIFIARGALHKFCCEECAIEYRRKVRKERTPVIKRKCGYSKCGKEFIVGKNHVYCCVECQKLATAEKNRRPEPQPRICKYNGCKKEFIPKTGRQLYCCKKCSDKNQYIPQDARCKGVNAELHRLAREANEVGMHYGDYVAEIEGVARWRDKR